MKHSPPAKRSKPIVRWILFWTVVLLVFGLWGVYRQLNDAAGEKISEMNAQIAALKAKQPPSEQTASTPEEVEAELEFFDQSQEEIDREMAVLLPLMFRLSSQTDFLAEVARLQLPLPAGATQQQAAEALLKWAEGLPVLQKIMNDIARRPWPPDLVGRFRLPWATGASVFAILMDAAAATDDTQKLMFYAKGFQDQIFLFYTHHAHHAHQMHLRHFSEKLSYALQELAADPKTPTEHFGALFGQWASTRPLEHFRKNHLARGNVELTANHWSSPLGLHDAPEWMRSVEFDLIGRRNVELGGAAAARNAQLFTSEGYLVDPVAGLPPFVVQESGFADYVNGERMLQAQNRQLHEIVGIQISYDLQTVSFALELHRRTYGAYPVSLTHLTTPIPNNPLDGKPYNYVRDDTGWTLGLPKSVATIPKAERFADMGLKSGWK